MFPAVPSQRLAGAHRPALLVKIFAPPLRTQDGGAQRSRGRVWGLLRLTPFPTTPLDAKRREPRGRGPGGDRGYLSSWAASPRPACAAPTRPRPESIRSRSPLGLTHCPVVVHHHQASKAELSPPARAYLHFRDVWPFPSQTARLQNRDFWTGTWPPFPPLRLHPALTHFFLRFLVLPGLETAHFPSKLIPDAPQYYQP